jgi:hypothetical protein
MGDCWDGFLTINGFSTTTPIDTLILGEPMIRK